MFGVVITKLRFSCKILKGIVHVHRYLINKILKNLPFVQIFTHTLQDNSFLFCSCEVDKHSKTTSLPTPRLFGRENNGIKSVCVFVLSAGRMVTLRALNTLRSYYRYFQVNMRGAREFALVLLFAFVFSEPDSFEG